ncbi:VanZ family protein [Kitasatospora kifunensis]|uniref:VanZ-like domain-containing protein n=1 Tax=Kitasatospora kifunensis TaxID=58351 RepID=A0A7W7VUY3_KITKI|nr:VanZ family protein [Kitasatospora kifunensis]MBB4923836.1 hypothetical protein [Kitasatospora kifunensis]
MIRAILRANVGMVPVFLVMALLLGLTAWRIARRYSFPRWALLLFAVSLAGELTATLYPTGRTSAASLVCTYSKDLAGAFADEGGLLNVAMYVPVALFATAAFGRPLTVLTGCWVLSASTETLQALLPGIGRACDSDDFVTNATGAAIGVVLACAWQASRGQFRAPTARQTYLASAPLAIGAVVLSAVQSAFITPEWPSGTLNNSPSANRRAVADKDAALLFGPDTKVIKVQDQSAIRETPELLLVTTATKSFSIEWPSGQLHDGTAFAPQLPADGSSDGEARAAADALARQWFPDSLRGATVRVYKVDPTKGRRDVEYRRYGTGGLLEPMRLDIEVDPGGSIPVFTSRNVPDPVLPTATVTRERAVAVITAAHPGTVTAAFLLAAQVGTLWHPCWAVTVSTAPGAQGSSYDVDAVTGSEVVTDTNP